MPSLSGLQLRFSGLKNMFVDEAEAQNDLLVTKQKLDFGEDWLDKQNEREIRDKVERQSLKAAAESVKALDIRQLDYTMPPDDLLELVMPRVFHKSLVALEELRILETKHKFEFLESNIESDVQMTKKTNALKIQLLLVQERNSKTSELLREELVKMQKNLVRIKRMIGISHDFKAFNNTAKQDVIYKDAFKVEVLLKIEKYGGTITIQQLNAYVKFSIQNRLMPFKLNPILRSQKESLIRLVRKCGVNALKENGVRQFRLGFFLGIKPLYDILTDLAIISTIHFVNDFLIEDDFIHVQFEVYPVHRQFQAFVQVMIGISSHNQYTFDLQSVKIDPLFKTRFVKLEQGQFRTKQGIFKKVVMVPCRRGDDLRRHDVKIVLNDYYTQIKQRWVEITENSPYHRLLDLMIATQEVFYYED